MKPPFVVLRLGRFAEELPQEVLLSHRRFTNGPGRRFPLEGPSEEFRWVSMYLHCTFILTAKHVAANLLHTKINGTDEERPFEKEP